MVESVNCPKCATHYALRPPRVQRQHRRAKCFTCDHIFSIAEEVRQLMAGHEPGKGAMVSLDDHSDQNAITIGMDPNVLNVRTISTTGLTDEEVHTAFMDEATTTAERPLVLPDGTETFSEGPLTYLPPLTLHDLEEPDSAMEQTLVLNPEAHPEHRPYPSLGALPTHTTEELEALGMGGPPPMPESLAESAPGTEAETPAEATSTYSSARDAIDKLMAGTPSVQRARPMSMGMRGGAPMDVETTLDALELTLGGVPAPQFDSSPDSGSTSVLSPLELDRAMSAQTAEPSAPTRFMQLEDMQAEDSSPQASTMRMPMPTLLPPPPPLAPTVALATSSPEMQPHADAVKDPNLLKIQLETETLSNVAMEQLILLVEQGRVKEYHLVARQFSENWLEANKVPALRPVFERLRRITQIGPVPTLVNETAPVKKSLFGGLFGSKN